MRRIARDQVPLYRLIPALLLLVLLLVLAACADDDDAVGETPADPDDDDAVGETPADPDDDADTASLRVGTLQIATTESLLIAQEEGFFQEQGLEVEIEIAGGGAELLPAVEAGELDATFTNVLSPILARGQGFDFVIIAPSSTFAEEPPDTHPMLHLADSPYQEPEDLEGARIATNNLQSLLHLYMLEYLDMHGVDPNSVTFVEAPFPTMLDGLRGDQYDLAAVVEPVRTIAEGMDDIEEFDSYFSRINPGFTLGAYVARASWIEQNPDEAERLVNAIMEANAWANDNWDEYLDYAEEWTGIDREVLEASRINEFDDALDVDSIQMTIDLAEKHGFLDEGYDVDEIIWEGAPTR